MGLSITHPDAHKFPMRSLLPPFCQIYVRQSCRMVLSHYNPVRPQGYCQSNLSPSFTWHLQLSIKFASQIQQLSNQTHIIFSHLFYGNHQSSSHSSACYFTKHFGYTSDLKCSLLISCICISINHRNELESSNFSIHFYLWDLKTTPIYDLIFQLENRVNEREEHMGASGLSIRQMRWKRGKVSWDCKRLQGESGIWALFF